MDNIETSILSQGYIEIAELTRPWIPAQILRHGNDFNRYFLKSKPYSYQWTVLLSELHRISNSDPNETHASFFNRALVTPMLKHYMHVIKTPLSKSIRTLIATLIKTTSWVQLLSGLKTFIQTTPMPANMPKYEGWVSAFKGNGAYNTMLSMIQFHNCHLYENGKALNTYESLDALNYLVSLKDPEMLYNIMMDFLQYNYARNRLTAADNERKI